MTAAAAFLISTNLPVDDLARRTAADVARHGAVVLIGRRSQARKLRQVRAALLAKGYQPLYQTNGAQHLLTVGPVGQPPPRAVSWWGPSS